MRIRPRQQLLDLWRSVLDYCYREKKWVWGGRDGSNSISDAEQLLCLLYPATSLDTFRLDRPDDIAPDVANALAPFGSDTRIGSVLVNLIEEYLARYSGEDDEPIFAMGSYLRTSEDYTPTENEQSVEIVDSYSMSLSLCIAAMRFLKGYEQSMSGLLRDEAKAQFENRMSTVQRQVGTRLTAAMAGLVRSFVIHTTEPESPAGQAILRMVNQSGVPNAEIVRSLSAKLEQLRVRAANEVRLDQPEVLEIANDRRLFECGWGWGVVRNAGTLADVGGGHVAIASGHAEPRPYLYFTMVALDGILDLSSQRIRELDLLDATQRKLADELQLRLELAQSYWSTVARFVNERWPLEDIPWRTSDGEESDYYSLVVTAILIQDLVRRDSTDDLERTVGVLDQLARRGRITSRPTLDDQAARLHFPGVRLRLAGSEDIDGGPQLSWYVPDFATLLLKRTIQAVSVAVEVSVRDQLMALAETTMDHIDQRAMQGGPAAGLWDDSGPVLGLPPPLPTDEPSWFLTERVMEFLVGAYDTFRRPPPAPQPMVNRAQELLREADDLLNRERLEVSEDDQSAKRAELDRIEQSLDRARQLWRQRPGTAFSLAVGALEQLDELANAREDATR
ncbi:SCO2524 family protein [Nocardia vaccinii]|uniref:SCO2524 family protein n=1 Tax=Nocardia vaccinii TaxID=1822 RepID=UPI00082954ED|nr:SCO2524 family protein [Nocardia vaccinii]